MRHFSIAHPLSLNFREFTAKILGFPMKIICTGSQVSYRFLALGCFPANLVSDVVCFVCFEGWFFERVIKNIMPVYC